MFTGNIDYGCKTCLGTKTTCEWSSDIEVDPLAWPQAQATFQDRSSSSSKCIMHGPLPYDTCALDCIRARNILTAVNLASLWKKLSSVSLHPEMLNWKTGRLRRQRG